MTDINIHHMAAFTIQAFHFISRTETISLSHDRENLLHARHAVFRFLEIVWPNFVFAFGFWVSWSDEFLRTYWIFRDLVFFCRDESPRTYIKWDQVHRRLWLCHDPFFSFLFLHPFRHRFNAAGQAEILRAAKKAEMADVKEMKKIVPLIMCAVTFG